MIKQKIKEIDIDVYEETLKNGLKIYIVPMKRNEIMATYCTRYGSRNNEFIPIGESKMTKFPLGIAHFLEHKVFEQKNGKDPINFFEERGCTCNAFTNKDRTEYYFTGINHFEENLDFLLNFVDQPYFTDKNVKKEKGIITQEIKMYLDNPWTKLHYACDRITFKNDDAKFPVIGTEKEINKITKEDLYRCYNTFYNPANMFLTIVGNVEPEKVIKLIKQNQSKRNVLRQDKIIQKEVLEPSDVVKHKEIIEMPGETTKVSVNYKVPILKNISLALQMDYLSILLDDHFGPYATLLEEMKKEQIIIHNIMSSLIILGDYMFIKIMADVNDEKKYINSIKQTMQKLDIDKNMFELIKKTYISSLIYGTEDVSTLTELINNQIIRFGKVLYDGYQITMKLDFQECLDVIKQYDFSNYNYVVIKPSKE